eukprot:TRINITY_DN55859_c0_g1_i1.p1 TRINITY_DN55859_c0_g1~~TRINITY_DN55859_c0_g1_i1.p1  ORF type:complete len:644 (+),score=148.99 TRINITY_DN55859_c0_g1_i1:63-1994(+)
MVKLHAWYMQDNVTDQKAPNRREPNVPASPELLETLGVKHWHCPPDAFNYPAKALPFEPQENQKDPKLQQLRAEWGMNYADIITITPELLPDYENKLKIFFEEHIHTDDEIRYILDGSGYFDVRDLEDKWVRIHCQKGDIISLPEGIYHRFTLDDKEYTKAMRLFVGDPIWTPFNRPQDENASRLKYRLEFSEAIVRQKICDTMRAYFNFGWCIGTSGGASALVDPAKRELGAVVTPSGVPKELLTRGSLFLVESETAKVISALAGAKLSDSTLVHTAIYKARGSACGAVLHTHSKAANLMSVVGSEFRVRDQEMIKGLGVDNSEELVVPIIENMPKEQDLVPAVLTSLAKYPKTHAILVRNHGLYAWGPTMDKAKCHIECLEYLLDLQLQRRLLASAGDEPVAKRRRCENLSPSAKALVLDVEGTTTPITFVKDTLFGFFTDEIAAWWEKNAKEPAGVKALTEIKAQLKADGEDENQDPVTVLKSWVDKDRKVPALKTLQGLVWKAGYVAGTLQGAMFDDVPEALQSWVAAGKRVYIFSSGSRQAQQLIFAKSDKGDLTSHLSGYFEPASVGGHSKQTAEAYAQIALSIGIPAKELLFCTDILGEAQAAQTSGWKSVLLLRPGNAPLPADHGFPTASSLLEV